MVAYKAEEQEEERWGSEVWMQHRGLPCKSHALGTTWQPCYWLRFAQALKSAWPHIEQETGHRRQQGRDCMSRQRLQCSSSSVTVADAPVKAHLEELLLKRQPRPPGIAFGSRAGESPHRQNRVQSKLQVRCSSSHRCRSCRLILRL